MARKKHHDSKMNREVKKRMNDRDMLHEDRNAVANMPQDVKYHAWGYADRGMGDYGIDDTIRGVDHQMDDDMVEARRQTSPTKY